MNGTDALLLEVLLKGVLLGALAGALATRASPATRVWLLRGLFITLLAVPLITLLAISSGLAFSLSEAPAAAGSPLYPAAELLPAAGAPESMPLQQSGRPWLIYLWLAGTLLGAGRLGRQLLTLRRWHRRAIPMAEQPAGSRPVQAAWSEAVTSPLSFGWRRPVILLPAVWRAHCDITAQDIKNALVHELAHLERRDWVWLLVSRLAGTIHWCNPLLPHLSRLLAQDTEIACDQTALKRINDTAGYASTLVKAIGLGQASRTARQPGNELGPALAMAGIDQWRRRIEHLYCREAPMQLYLFRLTLAATLALPMAAIQLTYAQPAAPQPPAPEADGGAAAPPPVTSAPEDPATPTTPVSPSAAPKATSAPASASRADALPAPEARAGIRRAEAARMRQRAAMAREAEMAEAARRRDKARAARQQRQQAIERREEALVAREEVRRANEEARQEQERLARQLERLQARMAEIEAELAESKARDSEG